MRTLVLGLGNWLLSDEGVGVHAARALEAAGVPDGVVVLEVGTAILDALPELAHADRVIVVDAVAAGGAPGTVYRFSMDQSLPNPCIASMHGFDITRVLALAERPSAPEVVVIGIEPARTGWSLDLSPEVSASLDRVIGAVLHEAGGLGSLAGA